MTLSTARTLGASSRQILEANNGHKYFKNYTSSNLTEVKQHFAELLLVLGIKSQMTDLEIQMLMIFIKAHFGSNTFADLKLAIGMNAARKLDKHYEHYQLLNDSFIGGVLTAYNDFLRMANVELLKAKESTPKQTLEHPEAKDSAYNFIKQYYEENKEFPMVANWSSAFDWMFDNKLTEDVEVMKAWFDVESNAVKKEIINEMFYAKNIIEKHHIESKLEGNYVRLECRKRYVKKMVAI